MMSDKQLKRLIWLISLTPMLAAFAWGWYQGGFYMALAAVFLCAALGLMVGKLVVRLLR